MLAKLHTNSTNFSHVSECTVYKTFAKPCPDRHTLKEQVITDKHQRTVHCDGFEFQNKLFIGLVTGYRIHPTQST